MAFWLKGRSSRLDARLMNAEPLSCERLQAQASLALTKISRTLLWGMPACNGALLVVAVVGRGFRADACRYVQSSSCVVRFLPEFFDCDWSVGSFIPSMGTGTSVSDAKADVDTSLAFKLQALPHWFLLQEFIMGPLFSLGTLATSILVWAWAKWPDGAEARRRSVAKRACCSMLN